MGPIARCVTRSIEISEGNIYSARPGEIAYQYGKAWGLDGYDARALAIRTVDCNLRERRICWKQHL